ncbi:MAG: hypothetical protein ACHQSE_01675, partial [Gemmatimonadales bacterium]
MLHRELLTGDSSTLWLDPRLSPRNLWKPLPFGPFVLPVAMSLSRWRQTNGNCKLLTTDFAEEAADHTMGELHPRLLVVPLAHFLFDPRLSPRNLWKPLPFGPFVLPVAMSLS